MINESISRCPLCHHSLSDVPSSADYGMRLFINCNRCGSVGFIENSEFSELERIVAYRALKENKSAFSRTPSHTPVVDKSVLSKFVENYPEYTALGLLDQLMISLCEKNEIGKRWSVESCELAFIAKSQSIQAANWCQRQAESMGLLFPSKSTALQDGLVHAVFSVSAAGWEHFYKLEKNISETKKAFLAMAFGNNILREKIVPHIKSACKSAGFTLSSVDEDRKAGLIDDKIRVDIRTSKFLVVDVSDGNQGAYFEAGFGEGLGKPVFYICDKEVFERHHKREGGEKILHFDVEHHDIIQWDKERPEKAAKALLASIRNTLPNAAKMNSN